MPTLNRRAALIGAAAVALPIPALAAVPDPIYAAIEARKRTFAALEAACDSGDDDRCEEACHDDRDALEAMLRTVPTTIAGVAALVGYVRACECSGGDLLDTVMSGKPPAGAIQQGYNSGRFVLLETLSAALSRHTGGWPS